MKRTSRLVCLLTAVALAPVGTASAQIRARPTPALRAKCPDLVATMTTSLSNSGSNGTVTLNCRICNQGSATFKVPPGSSPAGVLMRYVWYPPKTPAQVGDVQEFASQAITSSLAPGKCMTFSRSFGITGFVEWGHRTPQPGERQVSRQFVLTVQKFYPVQAGATEFTPAEDCTWQNNRAVAPDVHSMELVP